jgi:hypothetical protein
MTSSINNPFQTTAVRTAVRGAVASIVGALVAWGTTKWASLNTSNLSYLTPAFSTAYFAAVHFLQAKYPKFGWLLGVLPQKKSVAPTPDPAKAVAKKATAAKKPAPKK